MASIHRKTEVRVGVIALTAIVLLVAGIMWGKGSGIGVDRKEVVIEFDNAAGISTGTNVYLYGVKVGDLSDVSIQDKGAKVVAHINSNIDLHDDAYASIQVMELTGGKKIEIFPGSAGGLLTDHIVIPGRNQADIGAIIAVAQDLVTNAGPLFKRADTVLAVISQLIGDKRLQRNISTAADQFAAASVELNQILRENKGRISSAITSVDLLATDLQQFVGRNEGDMEAIIKSGRTLVGNASTALVGAQDVMLRVDRLVRRLDSIAVDLREGDGTISRFLYDKSFALELDSALNGIGRFIDNIDRRGVNVNVGVGHKK